MMSNSQKSLKYRVERFIRLNSQTREATLRSEQEFLKLAGNISAAQLHIILSVGLIPECTMSQLAIKLHFTQANITQMINRLIEKKFLKRTQSKADKRVFYISLLVKGKKIFDLHAEHVERTAREWFSKMTEEEQEGMLQLWEKTFS